MSWGETISSVVWEPIAAVGRTRDGCRTKLYGRRSSGRGCGLGAGLEYQLPRRFFKTGFVLGNAWFFCVFSIFILFNSLYSIYLFIFFYYGFYIFSLDEWLLLPVIWTWYIFFLVLLFNVNFFLRRFDNVFIKFQVCTLFLLDLSVNYFLGNFEEIKTWLTRYLIFF